MSVDLHKSSGSWTVRVSGGGLTLNKQLLATVGSRAAAAHIVEEHRTRLEAAAAAGRVDEEVAAVKAELLAQVQLRLCLAPLCGRRLERTYRVEGIWYRVTYPLIHM